MKPLDYISFPDFAKGIPEMAPEKVVTVRNPDCSPIEWEDRLPQDGVEASGLLSLLIAVATNLAQGWGRLSKQPEHDLVEQLLLAR